MQEYGGYIEFESYEGSLLHDKAIPLNCGRSALAYLCEAKHIQKLYLPYFICSSVPHLLEKIGGINYAYYHIDSDFKPHFEEELGADAYLYIVNFYGQMGNEELAGWKERYGRVIVDQAQSYYQMPVEGVDTIYTCRKYFGVSDGAFLYTDGRLQRELPVDVSFERMHFLLGRYECGANAFYGEYVENNKLFANEPIKRMSKLTENLLRGIDYERVRRCRNENFCILQEAFEEINELRVKTVDAPFMYPLLISGGSSIRRLLQGEKIYIPTLWPNVLEDGLPESLEYRFAADILPIPLDQRYGKEDMWYLADRVLAYLNK